MATPNKNRNHGPHNEPNFLETHLGKPFGVRLKSWLFTLDHKRIGMMYLFGILTALLVGGAFALLVRTELWAPGETIVGQDTYNQFFTLHGAVMVFLVIIPGIPAALGNIIMPIQLGAPDVAFPKLNLASFYLWCSGALCLVIAIPFGGLDTGWTLYTPYSLESATPVLVSVCGVFLLGFSSIFTGLNFLVTIHKFRPQGMAWFQMPLNIWAIYATAIMQVLATPVLGITVLLLAVERFAHIGIFDPNLGGDPVLFQHFFWFYSHPAVYIMIIPAMGVISEILSTYARKPIFGYRFIAYSSVSLALLSFLVWGHHMFVSGQSRLANMVFSALTFSVGIPAAIKVFNWVATLYKGDIRLKTAMLYALSFLLLFTIGGLTGLFLGILSVDVHLHDTYFVVAHFHYVMMGSTLVAFLGALHHWWPKFTGRMYNEGLGKLCAIGVFIGFNMTFLPQFVMGSRGMPRRYWDYDAQYQTFHQISTLGAFLLGVSLFVTVMYLMASFWTGKKATRNPWGGSSLEWQAPTPPPLYNFEKPPELHELYNYDDLVEIYEDDWVRNSEMTDSPATPAAGSPAASKGPEHPAIEHPKAKVDHDARPVDRGPKVEPKVEEPKPEEPGVVEKILAKADAKLGDALKGAADDDAKHAKAVKPAVKEGAEAAPKSDEKSIFAAEPTEPPTASKEPGAIEAAVTKVADKLGDKLEAAEAKTAPAAAAAEADKKTEEPKS